MKFVMGLVFTLSWICFILSSRINEVDFESVFEPSLIYFILQLTRQWRILRDRFSSRPEFASSRSSHHKWSISYGISFRLPWICFILSLRVNEVDFEIGFQAVLNLLHFKLTCQWSILRDQLFRLSLICLIFSLLFNEVDFVICFQSVLNLLHFTAYAPMK
jgi:hypothetical protein